MSYGFGVPNPVILSLSNMDTEIERTYLLKYIPPTVKSCKFADYRDLYIPFSALHPRLRLRKRGQDYELTKKVAIDELDRSVQKEMTITLDSAEYDELATTRGKEIVKRRFFLPVEGKIAEIDIFQGQLLGLVLADFEFVDNQERDNFVAPDFCLAEVTQETFIAGGMLAGKSFQDITPELERLGYKPLAFQL